MLILKGALFLLIVACNFYFSYHFYLKKEIRLSLIFIIIGGFLLRLWCCTDPFLYAWDERYHALVAKHLAENPFLPVLYKDTPLPYHFQYWTHNHIWLHKPPLALWLMSFSVKIFGISEITIRLPSLIFSTICIYFTYKIATFYGGEKVGLLAAFFHSINGLIIELASGRQSTDHIDTIFLFFIELSVFWILIFLKNRSTVNIFLIGIFMGCAILTKWLTAFIILPIFINLTLPTEGVKKTVFNLVTLISVAFLVAFPWQWYIFHEFPQEAVWEQQLNWKHLIEAIEGHSGAWWWYLDYARKYWNEFIFIAFIWFLIKNIKDGLNSNSLSLIVWVVVPYIFFSCVATKMVAYPLFTAPAIFTILAMFWWYLKNNPLKFNYLNKIILISIIVLSMRYSYERVKPFRDDSATIKKLEWIKKLNKNLPDKKTVIFNTEDYVEIMFYTDFIAYHFIPSQEQIVKLTKDNYKVFIVENNTLKALN